MQFDIENTVISASINAKEGLKRCAGIHEIYIESLEAFVEDGNDGLNEIPQSLQSGDLNSYSTHVHGIKSALHTIGADDISQKAYDLELAANNNDLDYIKSHNDAFIDSLTTLVGEVEGFLDKDK